MTFLAQLSEVAGNIADQLEVGVATGIDKLEVQLTTLNLVDYGSFTLDLAIECWNDPDGVKKFAIKAGGKIVEEGVYGLGLRATVAATIAVIGAGAFTGPGEAGAVIVGVGIVGGGTFLSKSASVYLRNSTEDRLTTILNHLFPSMDQIIPDPDHTAPYDRVHILKDSEGRKLVFRISEGGKTLTVDEYLNNQERSRYRITEEHGAIVEKRWIIQPDGGTTYISNRTSEDGKISISKTLINGVLRAYSAAIKDDNGWETNSSKSFGTDGKTITGESFETKKDGNVWRTDHHFDSESNEKTGRIFTYKNEDGTFSYEEHQDANGNRLSSESITINPDGSITKESIQYGEDGSVDSKIVKKILPDGSEEISENPDKIPPVVPEPSVPHPYEPGPYSIDPGIGGLWDNAKQWTPPRYADPLTLDLDNDGLETLGIDTSGPIYFDHNNDGIKTATGWIGKDDGLLVLDRNGNGTIDNGGELFGNATSLGDGSNAEDGFAALAAEDTNGDGKVDANDARFAELRVWRDLNSDGISQSDELFTLESLGIASLNVAKTENSTPLANGNVIADLGSYTRTDGSTGTMGDIDFRENTFLSRFADAVPISDEAALLPNMYGAGQVRCLREAASLSPALATALAGYAAATTGDEQKAMLDGLLKAWSDTSPMAATATGAYAGHALTVTFQGITPGSPEHQAWLDKLTILERFNGQTFRDVPAGSGPVSL